MDIKYLETVLAVAKYQSFSLAAEAIPCSQASVSRQVNEVEQALGHALFNRKTKRGIISLTEMGKQVIPEIEAIVERFNALFYLPAEARQTSFRLGILAGLFDYKAKHTLVSHIFTKHPEIHLTLIDASRRSWLSALMTNQIDGMFMHDTQLAENAVPPQAFFRQNGLRYTFLKTQPPSIVFPEKHPLAERKSVAFSELAQECFLFSPLLMRNIASPDDQSRERLEDGFVKSCIQGGFTPKMASLEKSGTDFANLRNASINANGWIYPTFQIKSWCGDETVRFVPVEDPLYFAQYYFVTLDRKPSDIDQKSKAA